MIVLPKVYYIKFLFIIGTIGGMEWLIGTVPNFLTLISVINQYLDKVV